MISLIQGTLVTKDLDRIAVMTASGVGYELHIPLSVFETLPDIGEPVTLHTSLVVKEELWQLFGFSSPFERKVFEKTLTANGIGPALAIGLLSSLTAPRLVRAILDRDIPTLQSVPRVGRKKAERMILDLVDKMGDLQSTNTDNAPRPAGANADDAIRGLVSLGYNTLESERAVREALDQSDRAVSAAALIRTALALIGSQSPLRS